MRIVVDCRYVRRDGRHDGISRYSARLVEALGRRHPVTMLISDERQRELLPDLPFTQVVSPTSALEPFVALQVNRLRPDVVVTPMQTMGRWGRRYRLVVTVHDLIYYRHPTPPGELPAAVRLLWRLYHLAWWPQRLLLNSADRVLVVSETTKTLVERHRLTRRPLTVVPNAADPGEGAPAREAPVDRVLIYMGSFMPYKNVETLARALHLIPGYRLHLMSRVTESTRRRLEELAPAGSLVFANGASDEEYHALLARATALLSASRDEGFGIPLIEAMREGTPVVVSDIPIFREIGGEAALYADPDDAAAFAAGVRLLEDAGTWREFSERGRRQAALFSWDRSAEALLEALRTDAGE